MSWMACASLSLFVATSAVSAEDLGSGYQHHGVATPISNHRGVVATVDGAGRDVVLLWLYDHRGGYALLMIDAETGKSEEHPMPFPPGGDCPFASILSSGNKFYTHFNSHFCEFDPVRRKFTFHHRTVPRMAMGMTEDDSGVIWSVTYPQSGVASFNPETRAFKDYGHVHKENWSQYQRDVAADDTGWIYFGIGNTASHILALNPADGTTRPMIPDDERVHGAGEVHRDLNGKVYGFSGGKKGSWYELYRGQARKLRRPPKIRTKPIVTGSQGLFHQEFPDGKRLLECDLVNRVLTVEDRRKRPTRVRFDYHSEGAHIMGLATAPDGTICGGTAFPMRFFSFDPKTGRWINRACYGQWNTVTRLADRFFVGAYTHGSLMEWDPSRPWVPTELKRRDSNPRLLAQANEVINRPHDLLATPDGEWLVLAGTPGYGLTGGGLLLWDRKAGKETIVEHTEILPQHSTMSLLALPDGKLLGGSTTGAGTGGERKADLAELYVMDIASRKLEWHEPLLPGVQSYCDLCPAPNGLVYGFADFGRFFVLDPTKRQIVHQQDAAAQFGRTASGQGPRVFVRDPGGTVYILFAKGIARIGPRGFTITLLAPSPVPVGCGGDYLDGRIYFANGSHVYSYQLPPDKRQ